MAGCESSAGPSHKEEERAAQAIHVENLREALRLAQRHLTYSLTAAVLYFLLWQSKADGPAEPVELPGGFRAGDPETAKLIVAGAYWVATLIAGCGIEFAREAAAPLAGSPRLLSAALRYPSIVTSRFPGYRWVPPIFIGLIVFFAHPVWAWSSWKKGEYGDAMMQLVMLMFPLVLVVAMIATTFPLGPRAERTIEAGSEEGGD